MSDIVKIVFDGDLGPLEQKQAAAKAQLNTFVAESEAKLKGIPNVGDPVGLGGITAPTNSAGASAASDRAAEADKAKQALEGEAAAAELLSGALAKATASQIAFLAVSASIVALGAALVLVAKKLAQETDLTLSLEERRESAINRQLIGLKESLGEYQKIKDELVQTEALQRKIAGYIGQNDTAGAKALRDRTDQENKDRVVEINRLQAALATNERQLAAEKARKPASTLLQLAGGLTQAEQRQNVGFAERNVEQTKKRLAEEEEALKKGIKTLQELERAQGSILANRDAAFSSNFDNFVKAQEQRRKFAEEQAEKFAASVKAGKAEVEKLVSGYRDAFVGLASDASKDNPFAQQIIQSATALDTLEEKLKGVGPALRKQATDLAAATAAQEAYKVGIDNAFETIDLRAQANRFRNPTQADLQKQIERRAAQFNRESNSSNPDVLNDFRRQQEFINQTNRRQQSDILNQKFDVAGRARTEAEKAIADKALTSFAGGINPDDLSQSERSKIADAFERSAVRNEARQEEGLKVQRDLLATMKSIDKRGATLMGVAGASGKTGVDITVRDESDRAEVNKRPKAPSPADTKKQYDPDLLYSGPNGLRNW